MKKTLSLLSITVLLSLLSACAGQIASSSESSSSPQGDSSEHVSSSESSSSPSESSDSSSSSEDASYYSAIDWSLTGATLKSALSDLIYPHTQIGYQPLRYVYATTDADENGKIVDIYSDCQYDATWVPGLSYTSEGVGYNREHIIPQNLFSEDEPFRSDIFHVYPTDGYVNNRRGNYPHGQVGEATYTSGNGSKLGPSSFSGYSGTVFEPIDKWKGDIARSYFYMVTCYEDYVSSWKSYGNLAQNTYPSLSSWTVELFLKWHDQDPVDEWESGRNERCYGVQGNRNPFIDHPEAAHLIWDSAY